MKDYSWQQIVLCWGIIIAVVAIYVIIREKINLKKAATGEDKERIANIFKQILPDTWGNYKSAFACWEKKEYRGRQTITRYWSYAISFSWDEIYIVPLLCEDRELRYKESFCITKESVGMVNAKKGENWMTLYDHDRNEILTLQVKAENTKSDRFHPVNIVQDEEAAAFSKMIDHWLDDVNGKAGIEVSGVYGNPFKKVKKK